MATNEIVSYEPLFRNINFVPGQGRVATLQNSTFLDFAGYQLTSATTVADAYGLTNVRPAGSQAAFAMALILDRANDPTTLLNGNWAQRQAALAALNSAGTLASTFGARQSSFDALEAQLGSLGIPVLGASDGFVSSAASRTAWVKLDASQFSALFGADLMVGDLPDGGTLVFWNGDLAPTVSTPLAALWLNYITAPTPSVSVQAVALQNGPQSPGNSSTAPGSIYANALGQLYDFPLIGSSVKTGTIGITEPAIGLAVKAGVDPQTLINEFRAAAGAPGSGTISAGPVEQTPALSEGDAGERAIDVGVAGAASPNSNLILYAGNGPTTYPTYQEAFWGSDTAPDALSSSYGLLQLPSPNSPFYAAQQQLFIDAALRNVSVFLDSGDQGSSAGFATGVPQTNLNHSTIYATIVGGTSLSSLGSAKSDPTLKGLVSLALTNYPATLRQLVAGGLKHLPAQLTSLTPLAETVWNQYVYDAATTTISSYTINLTGAGGVDATTPEPGYQTAFGIEGSALNYDGQPGRTEPDVAALAGGNMFYFAPGRDLDSDPALPSGYFGNYYGTSASTPLWAALTAQIQAVFQDVGLPTTGYFNDLLYNAAAISPAAFNDVTIGNNVSSYAFGGPVTDASSGLSVSPTGLGYRALPGYDLVTGLGSPNGLLLTRSLVAIAEAQSYSNVPAVTDPTGAVSQASQSLIVQPTLGTGLSGEVGVRTGTQASVAHVTAGSSFAWSNQLAQQVLQPDFDGALVRVFDGDAQATPGEVQLGTGASIGVSVNGAVTAPVGTALTSAYGFVNYGDQAGDSVALARPVAVAQTVNGADDQDVIVRLRQNGFDQVQMSFYRVDDFQGSIAGVRPGEAGYADAASTRACTTQNGSTIIGGPGFGAYTEAVLTGVNAGDLIASVMTDVTNNTRFWGFAAGNEVADGSHTAHLWSYGLNTFGYEDTFGGGDRDYNDAVFQLDFTSLAGHGLLA